ncbi:MAG: hypothetical protein QN718_08895, partial [Nitrososphaeraceae archaeon]|nr:hypothetical protein [Nitrososphaeraceae archaeon]
SGLLQDQLERDDIRCRLFVSKSFAFFHLSNENFTCEPLSGARKYSYLSSLPKGISATSSL